MGVTDCKPKAGDDRARGLSPGANPESTGGCQARCLSSARAPSGNSSRARGIDAVELYRGRVRVPRREFDAGCHADALLHWRDQIASLSVEDRPRQARVAFRPKMPVIAALHREWQLYAQRA